MSYSAVSVANSIIKLANERGICDLNSTKLQKLMYFSQFWYLKNFGELLINDHFCRWELGPTIPSIYYELKNYKNMPISDYIRKLLPNNEAIVYMIDNTDSKTWGFLGLILYNFGCLNTIELCAITHLPYSAWFNNKLETVITKEDMLNSKI